VEACVRPSKSAIELAAVVALAAGACKKPPPPPPPPPVRVVKLTTQNIEQTLEWLATLDGSTNAEIRPQVSGYIESVDYTEGTVVRKGTLMFTLDKRPFIAAVEKAQGDYQNAIAQRNKAQTDVNRFTPLVAQHAVSKETLDDAQAAVRVGNANIKATRGALHIAKINLDWAEVRSPIDGLAGIALTRVGNLVSPNQTLAVVSTIDPIRSSVNISEREYLANEARLNRINEPQLINERIIELVLIDGRVHPYNVRRVIVNREVNPTTGTLLVQSLFPNPGNVVRPGMFAKVRVHRGAQSNVLVVPERAVQELQGRHQVVVIDDQQRVQVRTVKLGQRVDHAYVVEDGLRVGERVVVEGLQNALPGAKVKVVEESPPRAQAPSAAPDGETTAVASRPTEP
jgi:membrane fusion protein (multidrug efflux system)